MELNSREKREITRDIFLHAIDTAKNDNDIFFQALKHSLIADTYQNIVQFFNSFAVYISHTPLFITGPFFTALESAVASALFFPLFVGIINSCRIGVVLFEGPCAESRISEGTSWN